MAAVLWLLLAATVGGLAFPSPAPASPPSHFVPSTPAVGVRLLVPSLNIDAPVLPIEMVGSTLTAPPDIDDVGWWTGSAKPGAASGQTVIIGHSNATCGDGGPCGQMNHIGAIKPGSIIKIVTADGTIWYRETERVIYGHYLIGLHAEDLFGQSRPSNRLVLVTCTGWTGRYYLDNVVVFAEPLGTISNSSTKSS